jgi:N-acetylglucosamine-6-sulfatase
MGKISRADFLRGSFATAALPLGGFSMEQMDRPNILLILTDDQPYRSMSEMPKTVAAFADGMEFTNVFLATPRCASSRASLLTGLYTHNHEIYRNRGAAKKFKARGLHRKSLDYYLRQSGYTCGLYGKWENNYNEIPAFVPPGFARFVCTITETGTVKVNTNGIVRKPDIQRRDETSWLTSRAVAFMQNTLGPWFCIASINNPHDPYTPSLTHAGSYANRTMTRYPNFDYHDPGKPAYVRNDTPMSNADIAAVEADWRGKMEELQDVDDAVEALVAAAGTDTYIFYLTDNGFMLGEHGQRYKAVPYEEAIRTPFYVKGPSVRVGATSNILASGVDVPATIYELTGLYDAALATDGMSLLGPMISDEPFDWRDAVLIGQPNDPVTSSGDPIVPWHAIRTTKEIYVEYDGTGEREYYDLDPASPAYDPYQLTNTIGDRDRDTALSRRLYEMRGTGGDVIRAMQM